MGCILTCCKCLCCCFNKEEKNNRRIQSIEGKNMRNGYEENDKFNIKYEHNYMNEPNLN